MTRRTAATTGAKARSRPAAGAGPETAARPEVAARPAALRLASLHLRMGQLSLARAELESFAGRGLLDEPALLDLAEVRWRTGDLAGAGEAANVLLARGREEPLALVVAAEAVAALGRPGEARRLAGRALSAADGSLDPLFAGMPRALIWPGEPEAPVVAEAPDAGSGAGGHAAVGPGAARRPRGRLVGPPPEHGVSVAAPNAAVEAFAGGRAALASGDDGRAALLLGVALRLDPEFAEGVLDALGEREATPLLALVAGDAYRLLGREAEAHAAFDRAGGHVPGGGTAGRPVARPGPGLFDDDPAAPDDEPGT